MSLWEDIQPWIDKETGLMTATNGGRDNLILMSTYLRRQLYRVKEDAAAAAMWTRMDNFLRASEIFPGLYLRSPSNFSDNSIDNLIGACWSNMFVAERIRLRWNSYLSCFDVNNERKIALNRNFYARFLGVKAYIVASSGLKPNFIQRLIWTLAVVWSVYTSKGSSDPLLLSLQVDAMRKHCPRTAAFWDSHYTLQELLGTYFGPNHPIALSAK